MPDLQRWKRFVDWFESLFPDEEHEKYEDKKAFWGLSTASAVLGIERMSEIIGALLAHTVGWYGGGQGPSVVYNFLTGVRISRGQYMYTFIPLGTNLNDLDLPQESQVAHVAALAAGYIASTQKWV